MYQMNWQIARKNIKAIVFDVDGTLYSSEEILHLAYQDAIQTYNQTNHTNLNTPPLQSILALVGQPAKAIFAKLFPQLSEEERRSLNTLSLNNLCNRISAGGGMIYSDVRELLEKLTQVHYPLFLASNGRRAYVQAILDGFSLGHYFHDFMTVGDSRTPTKSAIISYYLTQYGWEPSQSLMVGDRTSDIEAANEAGTFFCGAAWGHGPLSEIENAHFIAQKPLDIWAQLIS